MNKFMNMLRKIYRSHGHVGRPSIHLKYGKDNFAVIYNSRFPQIVFTSVVGISSVLALTNLYNIVSQKHYFVYNHFDMLFSIAVLGVSGLALSKALRFGPRLVRQIRINNNLREVEIVYYSLWQEAKVEVIDIQRFQGVQELKCDFYKLCAVNHEDIYINHEANDLYDQNGIQQLLDQIYNGTDFFESELEKKAHKFKVK